MIEGTDLHFTAQIFPGTVPLVEFARPFLDGLVGSLTAPQVRRACLDGLEGDLDSPDSVTLVADICLEVMLSTLLLHELFHILCGHIDAHAAATPEGRFSEAVMGFTDGDRTPPRADPSEHEVLAAYFRELEADNCALQAMAQLPPPPALRQFLCQCLDQGAGRREASEDLVVGRLTGVEKVITYRFLLVAVWQVIRAIEATRTASVRRTAAAYPYPGARLLAAVFTLLESFVGLRPDTSADGVRVLDAIQAREGRVFLECVLRPVLLQEWPVPPSAANAAGVEGVPVWVMAEVANLMLGRGPMTPEGHQLEKLYSVRAEMVSRLAQFKYYS